MSCSENKKLKYAFSEHKSVETIFGQIKCNMGLKSFILRVLNKVDFEMGLWLFTMNIKRMYKKDVENNKEDIALMATSSLKKFIKNNLQQKNPTLSSWIFC